MNGAYIETEKKVQVENTEKLQVNNIQKRIIFFFLLKRKIGSFQRG